MHQFISLLTPNACPHHPQLLCFALLFFLSGCASQHEAHTNGQPPTPIEDPQEVQTPPDEPLTPEPQETPEVDDSAPNRIRLATWNVHNLFDPICDTTNGCGGYYYEPYVTSAEYQDKLNQISNGIKKLRADVILLQEIEKESCLIDIQSLLGVELYPSYAFGEIGSTASVDVAILTRGTITNVRTYRDQYWIDQPDGSQKRLARELLAAEITLPNGLEVTAFTTHFVSKVSDSYGERRSGEAKLTQEILDSYIAEHPERFVVFGGDLNDTPDSEPLRPLITDTNLKSVADIIPPAAVTTWGNSTTFDYLFYTAQQSDNLKSAEVICNEDRASGYSSSDHCAVRAIFDF